MSNGSKVSDAPNIEAVLTWCQKNRPDIVKDIQFLIDAPDSPNQRGMLLLLVVGFASGRLYQSEHPELSVHAYHR